MLILPDTCKFVEYDAVWANELLSALNAYDAVTMLLDPYGPYTLDAVINDAVSANIAFEMLPEKYEAVIANELLNA